MLFGPVCEAKEVSEKQEALRIPSRSKSFEKMSHCRSKHVTNRETCRWFGIAFIWQPCSREGDVCLNLFFVACFGRLIVFDLLPLVSAALAIT